jgi:hypothetical protein
MKSDMKALLRVFACGRLIAFLVLAVGVAAAAEWLTVQQAAFVALGIVVAGAIAVMVFRPGRGLIQPRPHKDESDSN